MSFLDEMDDDVTVDTSIGGEEELIVDIDMTGVVRAGEFTIAPEGPYDLLLEDSKLSKAASGNISISSVFSIVGGNFDGGKVFHSTIVKGPAFTDTSMKYVKQFFDAVAGEELDDISISNSFLASFVGNNVRAHVKIDSYQKDGQTRNSNKVAYYLFS
jgi:hypothetical protein